MATVYKTHVFTFSAAHRLFNSECDEKTNDEMFGKCRNTHGHDYGLDITLKGVPNPHSGLLVSEIAFDNCVQKLISEYHQAGEINDMAVFDEVVATTENMCKHFWERLLEPLQQMVASDIGAGTDVTLFQIMITETHRNTFAFWG